MFKSSQLPILIILSSLFSSLLGCSSTKIIWDKPEGSLGEFNRDRYECVQQSRVSWGGGGTGDIGLIMILSSKSNAERQSLELFKMCMEALGYTGREVNEDEIKEHNKQEEQKKVSERQQTEQELKFKKEAEAAERHRYKEMVSTVVINGNDVLIDNENKLMWPKSGSVVGTQLNWQNAMDRVSSFNYAGYSDWRLPTIGELGFLYLYNDKLTDLKHFYYWSSTSDNNNFAKNFHMGKGDVSTVLKAYEIYVLPVRNIE